MLSLTLSAALFAGFAMLRVDSMCTPMTLVNGVVNGSCDGTAGSTCLYVSCDQGFGLSPSSAVSGPLSRTCPNKTSLEYDGTSRWCLPCDGVDYYQDTPNQLDCKLVTPCTQAQFASKNATSSTDRQCSLCTVCSDFGLSASRVCSSFSNTVCTSKNKV